MRVQFTVVGHIAHPPNRWADLEAVPQVGDVVNIPGLSQANTVVRTVVWYPFGDPDTQAPEPAEPFVYVVLGPPRSWTGD